MRYFLLAISMLLCTKIYSAEYLYILNDNCINNLYDDAIQNINNANITVSKDSYGIILSFNIENLHEEYKSLSLNTLNNLSQILLFLAKIENPVIIEVHTEKTSPNNSRELKNWEIAAVIANNAESYMIQKGLNNLKIKSVGYGEFFPAKNTPYNGGKDTNHIDIIILCNINGE